MYSELAAVGPEGRIYLAGMSAGGNVPVTANAFQPVAASTLWNQGFLLELDATGSTVLYGTYINVTPLRITVDDAGFLYVLASHVEPDNYMLSPFGGRFSYPAPIMPNAAQPYPGQLAETPVLLKFSPSGELVYGTFLGGAGSTVNALAADSRGAAIVCGEALDPFLPVSVGAVQSRLRGPSDAFVVRVSPDGTRFEALTYFGGGGGDGCADVKVDAEGNVVLFWTTNSHSFPVSPNAYQRGLAGSENLFAAKLDASFEHLIWSTYIGSGGDDRAQFLNLGPDGSLFLTGWTASSDFPATPGTSPPFVVDPSGFRLTQQPLVAILNADGTQLRSAYVFPFQGLGFAGTAMISDSLVAVGWATDYIVEGYATLNALGTEEYTPSSQGLMAVYLLRIDAATNSPSYLGRLPFSNINAFRPLGFAILKDGAMVVSGGALSRYDNLPVRSIGVGFGQSTAVVRLEFPPERSPLVVQVVNAASLLPTPVSPGQLFEVRGVGLSAPSATRVLLDGQPVPVVSATSQSIVALAPETPSGGTSFSIAVERDGVLSDTRTIPRIATNPALFTADRTGSGQALAENEDGSLNSPRAPASRGGILRLLATGLGTNPAVTVTIGGFDASVKMVGPASGRPQGYMAIDMIVPRTAPEGDYLEVRVRVNGAGSQPGVTAAIR